MIGEGWEAVFFEALIKKDGLWFVTTAVSTLTIGGGSEEERWSWPVSNAARMQCTVVLLVCLCFGWM